VPPVIVALAAYGLGLLGVGGAALAITHLARAEEKTLKERAHKRIVLLARRRGQVATFFMSDGKTHTGTIVATDVELLLVVIDPIKDKKGRRKDLVEVSLLDTDDLNVLND
jgi:hypothetical protein